MTTDAGVQIAPIPLSKIRLDGGTQPRVAIAEDVVSEYAVALRAGVEFPPPDVFYDGADYWLGDGFHRYHAAVAAGLETMACAMRFGTRRDAVLFSTGANQGHGLRRTNADKRKAVTTLLQDEEWGQWSNREIGRRLGVDHSFVSDLRASLLVTNSEKQTRTYTTKQGTKATMNVENIGKLDKSKTGIQERRDRMKALAAEGYTSRQIGARVGISDHYVRETLRKEGVDIPADKAVGITQRHDSNRILERIVSDAENLVEGADLIDFARIDRVRLGDWIDSLIQSRRALDGFIKRLSKEKARNGEAA